MRRGGREQVTCVGWDEEDRGRTCTCSNDTPAACMGGRDRTAACAGLPVALICSEHPSASKSLPVYIMVAFRVEDIGDVLLCSVSPLWATCKWLWADLSRYE